MMTIERLLGLMIRYILLKNDNKDIDDLDVQLDNTPLVIRNGPCSYSSANLISSNEYDKEKYLEMLLDSAEAVLSIFGFNRSLFGFDKRNNIGGMRFIISVKEILKQQDQNYELRYCCQEWQCLALASVSLGY